MTATVIAVAFVVSCGNKLKEAAPLDLTVTPIQVVDNMFAVESENGKVSRRIEADKMERFDNDSCSIEKFLGSFAIYSYNAEGLLESVILSDQAEHFNSKVRQYEYWLAMGNVSLQNVIKQETAETDSLFWDRTVGIIYTDCYVKMYSVDGVMQGYGMRADDKGYDAVINKPFNSYSVVVQDTTKVLIDSVNFIGPIIKK